MALQCRKWPIFLDADWWTQERIPDIAIPSIMNCQNLLSSRYLHLYQVFPFSNLSEYCLSILSKKNWILLSWTWYHIPVHPSPHVRRGRQIFMFCMPLHGKFGLSVICKQKITYIFLSSPIFSYMVPLRFWYKKGDWRLFKNNNPSPWLRESFFMI